MAPPVGPAGGWTPSNPELSPFHAVAFCGYIITMNDTHPPSPSGYPSAQTVVQAHRPVLRRIVEALRQGTVHARTYADWMDEDIDTALAPALVRKGAKRYLLETGENVNNEEDDQASPATGQAEFLSNLGLAVSSAGIRFRVLRSDDGIPPVPGPSRARQLFYHQNQLPLPGFEIAQPVGNASFTNCVLHWDTDSEYHLTRVYLTLPLGGNTTRDSVELLWNEIIWRRHAPEIDGAQTDAEVIDQDIYLANEASGTGG